MVNPRSASSCPRRRACPYSSLSSPHFEPPNIVTIFSIPLWTTDGGRWTIKAAAVVRRLWSVACLRSNPVEHARERDGLADVLDATHPRDAALDAHAEARVRDAAVATQIQVPLEGFARQVVRSELFFEEFERGRALASADDLAVALGRQHVHAEREFVALRVALHVEGFDGRRVVVNHNGL